MEKAELVVKLAELIEPRMKDESIRCDWCTDAQMALAKARTAAGDFRGAQAAIDAAEAFLAYGTRDEIDRAMLLVQQAGLLADLGEFERAVSILEEALPLFQLAQDGDSEAKVLLHQALILRHIDPSRAIALINKGLMKLPPSHEPRAELSAHYTRAYCHNELGDTAEAEAILATQRPLIEQFPEESVQLSIAWLQAKIRAKQGRLAEAELRLRDVLDHYLEKDFSFEAILVAIDLVDILIQQGRTTEGLRLAQEVLPVLRVWGLHRDTLALRLLIQQLTERRSVGGNLPTRL